MFLVIICATSWGEVMQNYVNKMMEFVKEKFPNKKKKKKNKKKKRKNNVKKKKNNSKKKKVTRKELFINKVKQILLKIFRRKNFLLVFIACLILVLILFFPFGTTNYKSEASGKILDIPKFSKLDSECCMYNITFNNPRSYISLKAEMITILDSYEKMDCDGKDYYYNTIEDYTITDYKITKGLIFNKISILYGKGNSCEIDTSFKNLDLLPDNYSIEDAIKDGDYVIQSGKVINASAYDEFMKNVSDKQPSTLRIVRETDEKDVIIIDLKYLSDGKFKVEYDATRDKNNKNKNIIMGYRYENIGVYKNKLYAYNGDKLTKSLIKSNNVYYLFEIEN